MTSYELLWLYARLRGIPEKQIKGVVDTEIKRLDLIKHANRLCGTYRFVYTTLPHVSYNAVYLQWWEQA